MNKSIISIKLNDVGFYMGIDTNQDNKIDIIGAYQINRVKDGIVNCTYLNSMEVKE